MNDDTTPPRATRHPLLRRLSAVALPSEPPDTRPSAEHRQLDPRDLEIARLRRSLDDFKLEVAAQPSQAAPESSRTRQGRRIVAVLVQLVTGLVGGAGVTIAWQRPEPSDRAAVVYAALAEAARQAGADQAKRAAGTDARIDWLIAEAERQGRRLRALEHAARRDRRSALEAAPEPSEPPPAPAPPKPVRLPETVGELVP